jgi:hypothetical protein
LVPAQASAGTLTETVQALDARGIQARQTMTITVN